VVTDSVADDSGVIHGVTDAPPRHSASDLLLPPRTGPLAGIRILDISTVVMGPYATQMLGDLGADVIKVEEAGGDLSRNIGPGTHPELSGVALNLHRNKRSICLDLKDQSNRPPIEALVRSVDVIVTNLRPAPLERLRLAYDDCRMLRPDIVFCQAQGWPSDSAEANRPAYDDVIQTAVGIPDLMQRTTGKVALYPTVAADKVCGQMIVQAVLAALFHRERTGLGQRTEVSMFEAMLGFQLVEHLAGATNEPPLAPPGYQRVTAPERGPMQASDGWLTMMPYDTKHWAALLGFVDKAKLLSDPRFATPVSRTANASVVYGELAGIIRTRTVSNWVQICGQLGIACEPVRSMAEVIADAETRGSLQLAEHPVAGTYRQIRPAIRFDLTPQDIGRHAPLLGEHTDEVLKELGLPATAEPVSKPTPARHSATISDMNERDRNDGS
jgi:crotonobetainyl-CoA:carnitine CoA-transferase CaiB-like acyl-CoA transferase